MIDELQLEERFFFQSLAVAGKGFVIIASTRNRAARTRQKGFHEIVFLVVQENNL
jgi:hypothetical protein